MEEKKDKYKPKKNNYVKTSGIKLNKVSYKILNIYVRINNLPLPLLQMIYSAL